MTPRAFRLSVNRAAKLLFGGSDGISGRILNLSKSGARVYVPRSDPDYALEVGLRMLRLRRLVVEEEGTLRVTPGEERAVAYYANSIAHLVAA